MKLTPAELRQAIAERVDAACAAVLTGNKYVINAVKVSIMDVDLPRLIPDKPTLHEVLVAQQTPSE